MPFLTQRGRCLASKRASAHVISPPERGSFRRLPSIAGDFSVPKGAHMYTGTCGRVEGRVHMEVVQPSVCLDLRAHRRALHICRQCHEQGGVRVRRLVWIEAL